MDKLLDMYNLPRCKDDEIKNLNRWITSKKIKSVISSIPINKSPGLESFTGELYQKFKETFFSNSSKKYKRRYLFQNYFMRLKPKPDNDARRRENYRPISLMDNRYENPQYTILAN